jgi:hypothetical protein
MPPFRCQFFFKNDIDGWSETHFTATAADIDQAHAQGQVLAQLRSRLVANPAEMIYIRTSDDAVKRDALRSLPDFANNAAYGNGTAAAPFVSLLLRLSSGSLYTRTVSLRGFPDGIEVAGGRYDPAGVFAWQQNYTAYTSELLSGRWAVLSKVNPEFLVTNWVPQVPDQTRVTITSAIAPALAVGDRIQVIGASPLSDLKGEWVVFSSPAVNQYVIGRDRPSSSPWMLGLKIKRTVRTARTINRFNTRGISHRDQGRPFGAHRGKRRAATAT